MCATAVTLSHMCATAFTLVYAMNLPHSKANTIVTFKQTVVQKLVHPELYEIGGFEFVASVGVHGYEVLPCLVDDLWCDVILFLIGEVHQ